jgi:hypothetical protein
MEIYEPKYFISFVRTLRASNFYVMKIQWGVRKVTFMAYDRFMSTICYYEQTSSVVSSDQCDVDCTLLADFLDACDMDAPLTVRLDGDEWLEFQAGPLGIRMRQAQRVPTMQAPTPPAASMFTRVEVGALDRALRTLRVVPEELVYMEYKNANLVLSVEDVRKGVQCYTKMQCGVCEDTEAQGVSSSLLRTLVCMFPVKSLHLCIAPTHPVTLEWNLSPRTRVMAYLTPYATI